MKHKYIDFLEEYKKLCIKHKLQILGFDDGAYVIELTDEEYDLECLAWEEKMYGDGSVGHSNLSFRDKSSFKNSMLGTVPYRSSTMSIKEENENN